jgi:hypothetical protein
MPAAVKARILALSWQLMQESMGEGGRLGILSG